MSFLNRLRKIKLRQNSISFLFLFILFHAFPSYSSTCREILYPGSPFGGIVPHSSGQKSKPISKKAFDEILSKMSFNKSDTTSYRVELQNETPNSKNARHADQFVEETQSLFKDQMKLRNENNFVTITESRRLKEEGDYPRSINIRVRSYRELASDENIKTSFDIKPHDPSAKYAKLFIHPPGEIPVRLEFKKSALDPESGKELEGVKEKPTIFCLKSEADALLDPFQYFRVKDNLKEKIKSYRTTKNLVNRPEEIDSMIDAIGLIHKSGALIQNPGQAILYQRDSYVGPNDLQITVDKNIRYIGYKQEGVIRDFPLDSRVVEVKFPVYIMKELKRLHELRPEDRTLALKSSPYSKEYETWRNFENLPTAEGAKRNSGKGSRGYKLNFIQETPSDGALQLLRAE